MYVAKHCIFYLSNIELWGLRAKRHSFREVGLLKKHKVSHGQPDNKIGRKQTHSLNKLNRKNNKNKCEY